MSNPYLIEGPALISFSGGRTSGFLLKHILDAYGGQIPALVKVCFANTGNEHLATLDFVAECSERWNVLITWLEYAPSSEKKFRVVTHTTASRDGEPFEALLKERQYLPNPVSRFCTTMLKIRVMKNYAMSLGWEHWTNAIGLRADEPHRVARIKDQRERWDTDAPLYHAGVTKRDVMAFWQAQEFDLRLPNVNGKTPMGNCVACFLKPMATISAIARDDPSALDWWIRMEAEARSNKPSGARFRKDRASYADIRQAALDQAEMDFGERDELTECYCTE